MFSALTFVFTVICLSQVSPALAAKSKCEPKNNIMRCFASSSQLASPYCSSFLLSPPTATSTVVITETSITYVTIPTAISTKTDLVISTNVFTSYSPVVVTKTETSFTTIVTQGPKANIPKRNQKSPKPSPTSLACLQNLKIDDASSISFACSCLGVTSQTAAKTISVTTTIGSTSTALASLTQTTTTTTTTQIITVLPSTTTTTESAVSTGTTSCFGLTIAGSDADQSLIGQVLMLTASDYDATVGQLSHFSDPAVAGSFYFSSTSALVAGLNGGYPGNHAGVASGVTAYYIQFANAAGAANYGFSDLVCNIDSAGLFGCTGGAGATKLEFCSDLENHLLIATFQYDATCSIVTLRAVPQSCAGVI